ncbi:MAG: Abi family protein, partial [Lactobacillus crispatus]|nr:Abi family protein [Lactobacillus crispatus]MCT7879639.1 Abi family protein [Lactobacillus crispatus]
FSLLIIKEKRQFLYKLVLNNLHQLANQEPCELAEERINKIVQDYLTKYPIEKDFLNKVFMEKKD